MVNHPAVVDMKLSFIIPVLNEAGRITEVLQALQTSRETGHEVIVVDGGSRDNTMALADPLADIVISSSNGRARQMNSGVTRATGDVFVFLHADTRLPAGATQLIIHALGEGDQQWGRFDVSLQGNRIMFHIIAWFMNLRSRLTGIATGDQCLFIKRGTFAQIGGYPDIPLMEDISISATLKKISRPVCLQAKVITSSRRWQQQGVWRTILLMWYLRASYFFGTPAERLVKIYYRQS